MLRKVSGVLVVLACTSSIVAGQKSRPVINAVKMFGQPVSAVEKVLGVHSSGSPAITSRDQPGEFREYKTSQGKLTVRFRKGVARSFSLRLDPPRKRAEDALATLGVNVYGRKPSASNRYRKTWLGSLGNPAIKEAAATNVHDKGFDLVVVKDRS